MPLKCQTGIIVLVDSRYDPDTSTSAVPTLADRG
jgi:hypothetical protein